MKQTNEQTYEQKDENYIPFSINASGIYMPQKRQSILCLLESNFVVSYISIQTD